MLKKGVEGDAALINLAWDGELMKVFPTRLQRGEHWLCTSCIPTIMSWSSPGVVWDYPTCGVCNVPRGKTSWRHGEGTEPSLKQNPNCLNPNCLCKPFIFNPGLQGAATSRSSGKSQVGKKRNKLSHSPPGKSWKVEQWEATSIGRWGFAPIQRLAHFSFLFSTTEKCQRANGSQELLPLLYLDKEVSPSTAFFLIYHQKEKSQNNLGYRLTPNDWDGKECFQLQGQILYVCSNQRQIGEKPKALELGIKRVCSGWICSNSRDSCMCNVLLGKSAIPKDKSSSTGWSYPTQALAVHPLGLGNPSAQSKGTVLMFPK